MYAGTTQSPGNKLVHQPNHGSRILPYSIGGHGWTHGYPSSSPQISGLIHDHLLGMIIINEQNLSPEMVSVQDMEKALGHIQLILQEHYAPFKFAFNSLKYFHMVPVTSWVIRITSYIQVKITLMILNSNYHIYEVLSVPLPTTDSGKHFTEITNLPNLCWI